jgi:hypothetical protein
MSALVAFSLAEEFRALSLSGLAAARGAYFSRSGALHVAARFLLRVTRRFLDRWRRGARP